MREIRNWFNKMDIQVHRDCYNSIDSWEFWYLIKNITNLVNILVRDNIKNRIENQTRMIN